MTKRTTIEGQSFPSRLEANVYALLKTKELAGEIRDVQSQVKTLQTKAKIPCKIDFSYVDCITSEVVYVEAKGVETERWGLVRKLWAFYGPGRLLIYKAGNRGDVHLSEEIIPEGD